MITDVVDTYQVYIYMAGDIDIAKDVIRDYVKKGLCVTIRPLDYIYKDGEEAGFYIGFINYPRFPKTLSDILIEARDLAELLRKRLGQESYTIVDPIYTTWDSLRLKP